MRPRALSPASEGCVPSAECRRGHFLCHSEYSRASACPAGTWQRHSGANSHFHLSNTRVLFVQNTATRDEEGRFGDEGLLGRVPHTPPCHQGGPQSSHLRRPALPSRTPATSPSAYPQLSGLERVRASWGTHNGPLCCPAGYLLWGHVIIYPTLPLWFSREDITFPGRKKLKSSTPTILNRFQIPL